MSSYRISSLPKLPPPIDRMRFRKAVTAMSVHPVNRRWLLAEAGLDESEVDSLLSMLDEAGVLLSVPDREARQTPRVQPFLLGWRMMKALLFRPIRLEGRGLHAKVVLEALPAEPAAPAMETQAEAEGWLHGAGSQSLVLMQGELRGLLARHPDARRVLTHMGFLEYALRKGTAHALPIEVLKQALDQLLMVGVPEGNTGLAILRSRLTVALLRNEDAHERGYMPVEIDEIGLSRFMEADRLWQGYAETQPMCH
jgi:hypothetical protein